MADHRTPPASRPWLVPAVIVGAITLLLLAAVTWWSTTASDDQTPAAQTGVATGPDAPTEVEGPAEIDPSGVERRDPEELLALGPVDAPVVLVVFSDYQCPFCAQWSKETLPEMIEHAEAGDLRIEHRDVNVYGEASERASRAAYAAAQQDEFLAYHDALYPDGEIRPKSELTEESLTEIAVGLGLDAEQFTADMNSSETAEQVAANQQLGLDLGAYSTPAFLLGGQPIVGAQPTQVFQDAFEAALAASEG